MEGLIARLTLLAADAPTMISRETLNETTSLLEELRQAREGRDEAREIALNFTQVERFTAMKARALKAEAERDEVREERDGLLRTFDIRWAADQRAIALWQALNPGNDLTWPDRADMVGWLLDRLDEIEMSEVTGWPWPQEKTLDELAKLAGRDRAGALQLAIDLGKTFGVPPSFAAHHYIADKGAERAHAAEARALKLEEQRKALMEAVKATVEAIEWTDHHHRSNLEERALRTARAALQLSETDQ